MKRKRIPVLNQVSKRCWVMLLACGVALPAEAQFWKRWFTPSLSTTEYLLPYKEKDLWGYLDTTGKVVVPAQYAYALPFEGGIGRVNQGGKLLAVDAVREGRWGAYLADGSQLITPAYRQVFTPSEDLIRVQEGSLFGYLNADGEVRLEPQYTQATDFSEGVAVVYQSSGNRTGWAFINNRGKVLSTPSFDLQPETLTGQLVVTRIRRGAAYAYGAINAEGEEIVPAQQAEVRIISPSLIAFKPFPTQTNQVTGWGLYHADGRRVAPPSYPTLTTYGNGLVGLVRNGRTAFYDDTGRLRILPQRHMRGFSNGWAAYENGGKWGYIDEFNRVAVPAQFDSVTSWGGLLGGYYQAETGRWGILSAAGKPLTEPVYDEVNIYRQRYALVHKPGGTDAAGELVPGGYGIVLPNGREAIIPRYGRLRLLGQAVQITTRPDQWGFVDVAGKFQVAPVFDTVRAYHEQRAIVRLGSRYGALDALQERVIPVAYRYIGDFKNGLAPAANDSGWGLINLAGAWVVPPQYDETRGFSHGLVPARKGRIWAYLDTSNAIAIRPQFTDARPFAEGYAAAKQGARWGFIDTSGRWVIQPRFSEVGDFHQGVARVSTYGDFVGYLDPQGRKVQHEVFKPGFAGDYSNGYVPVSRDGETWLFADRSGIRMTRWGTYANAWNFAEGLAPVQLTEGSYAYVQPNGELGMDALLIDEARLPLPMNDYLKRVGFREGLAPRWEDGLWGWVNRDGEWSIPAQFRAVGSFGSGLAPAQPAAAELRVGYLSLQAGREGQMLWPLTR